MSGRRRRYTNGAPQPKSATVPLSGRSAVVHAGITRRPGVKERKSEPSPAQAAVLSKLKRPRTVDQLATVLGRPRDGVKASLTELRSKGLVSGPVDGVWRRS